MDRIARPAFTISAQSMIYAQAAKLTKTQRREITAWADNVEGGRLARGVDAEDARPERFQVEVRDRNNVLIGHMDYAI
jgi:hypothetical protein